MVVVTALGLAGEAQAGSTRSEPLPNLDIQTTCRDQARYAFAATLGQAGLDEEFAACMAHEQAMRDTAGQRWANASIVQRRDCLALSGPKYSTLGRCLEADRHNEARP